MCLVFLLCALSCCALFSGCAALTNPVANGVPARLLHELVHVAQYRRNPVLFPLRYLIHHFRYGYDRNPAEVEARETASRLAASFFSG